MTPSEFNQEFSCIRFKKCSVLPFSITLRVHGIVTSPNSTVGETEQTCFLVVGGSGSAVASVLRVEPLLSFPARPSGLESLGVASLELLPINLGWAAPEDKSIVGAKLQSREITRANVSPMEPVIADNGLFGGCGFLPNETHKCATDLRAAGEQ